MYYRTRKFAKLYLVIALCVAAIAIIGSVHWYITYQAKAIALPSYKGPAPSGARARLGKGGISTSVVSSDGNYLAVGNAVGVYLYNAITFKQVLVIPCGEVFLLEFSPDNQSLLSIAYAGGTYNFAGRYTVSLWDVRNGRLLHNFEIISEFSRFDVAWDDLHAPLLAIERFHEIGKSDQGLYIGQWSIRLIDVSTAQNWQVLTEQNYIDSFVLSPDGTKVAYNIRGQVTIWSVPQKKAVAEITIPAYAESIIFSPNGTMLFVATAGMINTYETDAGKKLGQYSYSGDRIKLGINQDGSLLASVSGQTIRVWNVPDGFEVKTWTADRKLIDIAWDTTSSTLFTQTDDNRIYTWSVSTTQLLRVLEGHSTGYLYDLSWSADSKIVATVESHSGSGNGVLFLWDVDGNLLKKIDYPNAVGKVAWSPDNEWIVVPVQGQLVFLDRNSFTEVKSVKLDGVEDLAWSPDSTKLAVALNDRKVIVLDVATGDSLLTIFALPDWQPSSEFPNNPVLSVSWSPDASRIAAGMWDGPAYIWEANSGKQLAEFDHPYTAFAYLNSVIDVKWSPDSRYLVGGFVVGNLVNPDQYMPNNAITIWDTQTGEVYRTLNAHYILVMSIDWSPNSDFLAFSLMDDRESSSMYLWNTNDEPPLASNLHTVITGADGPQEVRWAPNGKMLAAGFGNSTVVIWDLKAIKPP